MYRLSNKRTQTSRFFERGSFVKIELVEDEIELQQVTVKPKRKKEKKFGNRFVAKFTSNNFFTREEKPEDALGREIGNIIKVDSDVYLKQFFVYAYSGFKNVKKFRLRFYDISDQKELSLIITPDIIFDITDAKGWTKVDLSNYSIFLEGRRKIVVSMQWIGSEKEKGKYTNLVIPTGLTVTDQSVMRYKSEEKWRFMKADPSMYIIVDSYLN